jgi:uncharacterized membrane protein
MRNLTRGCRKTSRVLSRGLLAFSFVVGSCMVSAVAAEDGPALQPADVPDAAASHTTRTYVFVCDAQSSYTVRTSGTHAWYFGPDGTLRLPRTPSPTGDTYSDGTFELRIDGEHARLGKVTGKHRTCRNDRRRAVWEHAKLNGADFRATGNEPGWYLEIVQGRRIVLVSDYGASKVEVALPKSTVDRAGRRTTWDAGELVVEVIGHLCRDSMSGERFEATVVVTWRDRHLNGCGRALH